MDNPSTQRHLVVVGAGMVAHRLVEALRDRDADDRWRVTILGEEPRRPYDRVALTSYFEKRDPDLLSLGIGDFYRDPQLRLRTRMTVTAIDRERRFVTTESGRSISYDHLVLATGSYAAVPPVPGRELPGCFVYRTIDDVAALRGWVDRVRAENPGHRVRGAVIGGGLLGLEAANALRVLDCDSEVIEFAPRLMPLQIDDGGGEALRRLIEALGVTVRVGTATREIRGDERVRTMVFADDTRTDVDVVIFATGVRPRDQLARDAGLAMGERGGVLVDDSCLTDDPAIHAIGEVACIQGRVWGLVGPGYAMAEVVADRLLGGQGTFPGADTSTKLKLMGVDVASFGDAFGVQEGSLQVVYADQVAGVYKKLVLSDDARTLRGGMLVGDASTYSSLRPLVGRPLAGDPTAYLVPAGQELPQADLDDEAPVCSCNTVSAGTIRCAVSEAGCTDLAGVKACTRAGTSCGSCLPLVKKIVTAELEKNGVEVSSALCEHFALTRAQLFDVVRVTGLRTFSEIVERHGTGRGCDICKPVVASILASLGNGPILAGEQAALQDTNDHLLANIQKDGTYSVVPRIPGGEITPDGLIVIGEIARDFGLYTKITGGQRIDLFGARVDQLPLIWRRLVDAGFESGHAYGKAVRTVKSCVGSTWCRYGVQDSVGMAVELELRYRGLRSPHKLKLGVSGCARECAEARGKDVGVIATEKGWNLYVGGNGGFAPKHARLLAEDLDADTLIRTIDRFLMYYIRTADRLQRTASWLDDIEGGLDHVRAVVLDDSLGIAADLDAAMARHVGDYVDEWRDVLDDPVKLARFAGFVNADAVDDHLAYVRVRGQHRPATPAERAAGLDLVDSEGRRPVLISGPTLRTEGH